MKKNAIIAAIASLTLVFGVTGTAVMLNGDKPATETSTAVTEEHSSSDTKPNDSTTNNAPEVESNEDVLQNESKATENEAATDADVTDTVSVPTKNSGKSDTSTNKAEATTATTPAAEPASPASGTGSAQVSGNTTSEVSTPHTDSAEQNQTPSEDTSQGSEDNSNDNDEDTTHKVVSSADVVRLTNDERAKNGLDALETESAIQGAADTRAKEIATNFSHTRPDGTNFSTAISGSYSHTGENIAYSTGNVTAEKFVSMWMASSAHKANILGDYTGIAVGIYYDKDSDTTYAVQLFVSAMEEVQYTYTENVVAPTCTEKGYTEHICKEDPSKSYKDNYVDALGHDYDEGVVTTPATCTEDGVKTYTCSRCNDTTTEAIKATGHKTEVQNAKAATCTEDGYTGDTVCTVCGETVAKGEVIKATGHNFVDGTCTVCGEKDPDYKPAPEYTYTENVVAPTCTEKGYTEHICKEDPSKSYKDNYVDALGHDYDDGVVTTPATCTEDGVKTYTCSRCNDTTIEVIKATGHKTEVQNAKAATCTEDGYTGDTVCTVCGETIAKGEVVKATGHNFVNGTCTVCGEADPDYKPAPEYTYTENIVAPTCTEKGYTEHICKEDPSKSYKDNYVDALGHDYDDGVVTTPATCTEDGVKTYTCSRCNDTTTEAIKATGHKTEIQNAKSATCTEDGYTGDTICTVCGETVAKGEVIKATGHKTEVQNAKAATCTEDGYTGDTVCTVCGETVAKGEVIKATGHDFVNGTCTICGEKDPDYKPAPEYTYTENVVAPTCTEKGYTEHICNEDANKSYKDNYTDALGHDWDGQNLGAKCSRCGTPLFVFDHTVDATCQDGGYDVYVSVVDPSQIRMTNFTDPIDHIYENGVCIMCGEKEPGIPSYDDNYDRTYYNNTIVSLTNQARESRGLPALRYASEYQAAADTRAQEIVSNFSHTRPNGSGPETTLDEMGCEYSSVGENIAYVSSMYKPSKIVDNWLASPGHASNMLSSSFDSFVVGTACSNGRVYAVQLFFKDVSAGANSIQTMTLDEAEAEAPAVAPETVEEATPVPTEEPVATETPEVTPAPTEEPEVVEETVEATPAPTTEPTPVPTPEATPAPVEEVAPEVTPAPVEEVVPAETPVPEVTPAPSETPAEPVQEESPMQEQDVTVPPEETELVVPQMEEIPDDTPADAAE